MKLIVCISDNNGMAFHHRRQSKDALLMQDMKQLIGRQVLWIQSDSEKLCREAGLTNLQVDASALTKAGPEDYLFLETAAPDVSEDRIDQVILYQWNKAYPADLYFRMDMSPFILAEETTIIGKSHPEIIRQIWVRN